MPPWRPWLKGTAIAGLFVLGLLAVSVVMPGLRLALGRRSGAARAAIVLAWNRAVCRILNLRIQVAGTADPDAGLLVSNHVSWLDIVALGAQRPCLFVAKEEVAGWPVLGVLARGIDTLFVRRGDPAQTAAVAEQMLWRLRRGQRVLLFPEGTTTPGERVLRFHSRLMKPAVLAGTRVQAVALRYGGEARREAPFVGDDDFLPHLLRILRLDRIDLRAQYCPVLPAGLDSAALAAAARRQVAEAILGAAGHQAAEDCAMPSPSRGGGPWHRDPKPSRHSQRPFVNP
jgi:1-acyl-sn-glycerol-3-phosphate acyltransferase